MEIKTRKNREKLMELGTIIKSMTNTLLMKNGK